MSASPGVREVPASGAALPNDRLAGIASNLEAPGCSGWCVLDQQSTIAGSTELAEPVSDAGVHTSSLSVASLGRHLL